MGQWNPQFSLSTTPSMGGMAGSPPHQRFACGHPYPCPRRSASLQAQWCSGKKVPKRTGLSRLTCPCTAAMPQILRGVQLAAHTEGTGGTLDRSTGAPTGTSWVRIRPPCSLSCGASNSRSHISPVAFTCTRLVLSAGAARSSEPAEGRGSRGGAGLSCLAPGAGPARGRCTAGAPSTGIRRSSGGGGSSSDGRCGG